MQVQSAQRITVRAYGSLNDFLPREQKQNDVQIVAEPGTPVKDIVERLGIPHPEVDLVLVDGRSTGFDFVPGPATRVSVYPRFHEIQVAPVVELRPPLPAPVRFILDGHLGKLARLLRLLGFDTAYATQAEDEQLAEASAGENRVLLTRDVGLLKRRVVTHGYFVRNTIPRRQIVEVLRRFGPLEVAPFTRCLECNSALREVRKPEVEDSLPPRTREYMDTFLMCTGCSRIYWKGAHWKRLQATVDAALAESGATIR